MASDEALPEPALVTTVLLARHAESEANAGAYFGSQSDSPLSARGRRQAAGLAEALSGQRVDAVYSSDLSRAVDTVSAIAAARGLTISTTPLLRERSVGVLTGKTFEAVRREHPEAWARLRARDPDFVVPSGESQRMHAERVRRFLAPMLAEHPGRAVLVASHGGTIHHLARALMGVADLAAPPWIAVDNASLTSFELHHAGGVTTTQLVFLNRVFPQTGGSLP